MSTRGMWVMFAVVIVPGIVVVGSLQEEPLKFIVIVGPLMFFLMGAGINLGELREIAREHEARQKQRALNRDRVLNGRPSEHFDSGDE